MIYLAPSTVLESLVSRTAGQTESEVVAPVARVAVAAVGNSGEIVAVPATATAAAVGRPVQVEAPRPHSPAHVINLQFVRQLSPYLMGFHSTISF